MKKIKSLGLSLAVISTLGFTGCGGGGGSSSGATSGLSFPSNAVSAAPTLANGQKVEDATATNQTSGIPLLNGVNSNSKLNVGLLGSQLTTSLAKKIKNIDLNAYSLNEVVDETSNCSGGGTMHYSGSGDDTSGGTFTFAATNCKEGNEKINGSIYASISNKDATSGEFKDISIKFTSDFTVTNLSDSSLAKISKNSYFNVNSTSWDSSGDPKNFKLSMSMIATDGSQSYGIQDAIFYFTSNGSNASMYQTTGKIYIDNLASYVNYDTSYDMSQTPFVFDYYGNLTSGEGHYNMANNGKVKIVAKSNEAKTYVDADGDGTYELSE